MGNTNTAYGPGSRGVPGPTGPAGTSGAASPRQLQQLNCVPTTVGLTPTAQTGGGTFHNVTKGTATVGYRLTTSAPGRTWTGLDAGGTVDGQCFQFYNEGTAPFTFAHQSASSAAQNQFTLPGGRALVLEPGEHVVFQREGAAASGKWVVVSDGDTEPAPPDPLTARQLQQLACVPTTVGLTDVVWNSGGVGNNIAQPAGGVGFRFKVGSVPGTWTGIAAGVNGQCIQFYNDPDSTVTWTLPHETGSAAANQFSTPGARPVVLEPGEHVVAQYDAEEAKWVIVSDADSEPGLTAAQTLSLGCIPTVVGLDPLSTAGPGPGTASPPGGVGYIFTNTSDVTHFGFSGSKPAGTCLQLFNGGNEDVDLIHLSGGSTALVNRIYCPEQSTYKLKPGNHVVLQYRTAAQAVAQGGVIPGNCWVFVSVSEGE